MNFSIIKNLIIKTKINFLSLSFKAKIIVSTLVVIGVLGLIKAHQIYQAIQMGKMYANPPPTIVVATQAKKRDWNPTLNSIGTLEAENGVDLTPEINGIVKKILFTPGATVKKGEVLVQLDTDVLSAQLKAAQAKRDLAALNFERTESLLQSQATSAAIRDESKANYEAAQAQFEQTEALLSQKTIKAPFDGKMGVTRIHLGQFIGPTNIVSSLESVDPIWVNFTVAEQNFQKIKAGQEIRVTVAAYPGLEFAGHIIAVDSKIGQDTKSILVQASLSNNDADHPLIPGMFAAVKIIQPSLPNQIIIPHMAVDYTLYGNSVYVITQADNESYVVKRVFIKTGEEDNDEVVVHSGLVGDELIVKAGQIKLHDGAKVSFSKVE